MKSKTVIITPVGPICNLNCSYCYQEPVRHLNKNKMSHKTLEAVISKVLNKFPKKVKFLWHGGEPLLAGKDFFKEAIRIQELHKGNKQKIVNYVQTNATLIDKEWANFFLKHNFKVGTSVDGLKNDHNQLRNNSYDKVVRGIRNLQNEGNKVSAILLVNSVNVNHAKKIWEEVIFPQDLLTSVRINVCYGTEDQSFVPSWQDTLYFMKTMFNFWFKENNPDLKISPFWEIVKGLMGGKMSTCSFRVNGCNGFIAVDERGDVYPCNRYLKRKEFCIGNVNSDFFPSILDNEKSGKIYKGITGLSEECENCKWLKVCGGGCPAETWMTNGYSGRLISQCKLRKGLFSHISKKIQNYKR